MFQFNVLRQLLPLTFALLATMLTTSATIATAQLSTNSPASSEQPTPPAQQTALQRVQTPISGLPVWVYVLGSVVLILFFLPKVGWVVGLIVVEEREVGIITKKFSAKNLPEGQQIALNGEAGLQADTLSPGWHFGYFPWQYNVQKEPVVRIPQDEIGLIIANDGAAIPANRILGKVVESENFQNARQFLTNGGEKGRQLAILTTGTYRLNTALFTVITSSNATTHGVAAARLKVYAIQSDRVGIVTTLDGMPIEEGEIAGSIVAGHDNFQSAQTFMDRSGRRGLQEQVMLSGAWNLNPWFVQVEQVPMTEVPIGYVGVVISYVGQAHEDVSGAAFTHGNLVSRGDKGVWIESLHTGKHPLNTKIMKVELVPTTNIVINFTQRFKGEHGYDSSLSALKLLSFDGFTFDLEVFQVIHVGAMDAPKVISRLGSMQNLVDQVLRPIVGNYFRNSAQEYTILDFLTARSERQSEAAEYIRQALRAYDVQAVDTLIGLISPPPELMQTLTDRKLAEEQEKTYVTQRTAQTQRQELVRETALADIQQQIVTAEQGVTIAELQATAKISQANGEAESIRVTGQAQADTYQAGVNAVGAQFYTAMQLMQVIGDRNVRIIPDIVVGGNQSNAGALDAMMGILLWNQAQGMQSNNNHSQTVVHPPLTDQAKTP